jgi:hypothetical protein
MHKKKTFKYTAATAFLLMGLGWSLSGDTIDSAFGKPKIKINTTNCKKILDTTYCTLLLLLLAAFYGK